MTEVDPKLQKTINPSDEENQRELDKMWLNVPLEEAKEAKELVPISKRYVRFNELLIEYNTLTNDEIDSIFERVNFLENKLGYEVIGMKSTNLLCYLIFLKIIGADNKYIEDILGYLKQFRNGTKAKKFSWQRICYYLNTLKNEELIHLVRLYDVSKRGFSNKISAFVNINKFKKT